MCFREEGGDVVEPLDGGGGGDEVEVFRVGDGFGVAGVVVDGAVVAEFVDPAEGFRCDVVDVPFGCGVGGEEVAGEEAGADADFHGAPDARSRAGGEERGG